MKKLLLIRLFFTIVIFFSITSASREFDNGKPYWVITDHLTTQVLRNCFFINNNTGWVSGDSGTIIKTTNAGVNWIFQNTGTFNSIEYLYFVNERLGWGVTFNQFPDSTEFPGSLILKTTNGGNNWTKFLYPDTNIFLRTIMFKDSLEGFVGGFPAEFARTTNNGVTWNDVEVDTTAEIFFPVVHVVFLNNTTGFACGGSRDLAGLIWKSTDGGVSWSDTIVGPEPLTEIGFVNDSIAVSVGGDFEFGVTYVRTSNQGATWQYNILDIFGVATAIDFRTPAEGWVSVTAAQRLAYTLDSGNNWESILTPGGTFINDIFFTDSINGWAVGNEGVILRYTPMTSVQPQLTEIINRNGFILHQNFPNPFNPVSTIKYELSKINFVTLKVYDALGKEVAALINEKQNAGDYSIEFDGSNLPSGIYFYELNAGEHSEMKKMLLLK